MLLKYFEKKSAQHKQAKGSPGIAAIPPSSRRPGSMPVKSFHFQWLKQSSGGSIVAGKMQFRLEEVVWQAK